MYQRIKRFKRIAPLGAVHSACNGDDCCCLRDAVLPIRHTVAWTYQSNSLGECNVCECINGSNTNITDNTNLNII